MKNTSSLIFVEIVLFLLSTTFSFGQNSNQFRASSDNWSATDGLGRKLPSESETGPSRKNKYIGMFYWTWHTDFNAAFSPVMNITDILRQFPEAATQADHPAWKGITPGVFWWDEPLFGYYRTTDEWILRKHAEMLADAGVDVVFFDCTNGTLTWKSSYSVLLKVWDQARKDGVKTPRIGFLLPFAPNTDTFTSLYELYTELYRPGLYKDLWFIWKEKPVIMAYPQSLIPQQSYKAGLKFTANAPFKNVNAACPSWNNSIGNLTFKLYKWNIDYNQSVSGTPIASKTFINFSDNTKLVLDFNQQNSGDYVLEISDGTEQVGVWKWTDSKDAAISFYNGVQVSGNYESEIAYVSDMKFRPLTTGTNHVPEVIKSGVNQATVDSMKTFFNFRPCEADYVNGPAQSNRWGWLENYPQHGFSPKTDGGFEQVPVGVAQNASDASGGHASGFNTPLSYGRSYTKTNGQDPRPEAYLKGLNFQEQWGRAFEIDPDLVYVTGWNEWIAGRWFNWDVKPFAFVDEYSAEKSRDIEPVKSWGNKGDVYYMQLLSNIRKFKGMDVPDTVSAAKTIDLNDVVSWADVKPEYRAYKGNTLHRNHAGQGSTLIYTNTTGRNDIVLAKVARDNDYLYFYVATDQNLTAKSDTKWMRLFIDIDCNKSTGWEGYDYVINRLSPGDSAAVEKSNNSWLWAKTGSADYRINGKTLVIKVKRPVLGIQDGQPVNFEFKWSDNMQEDGNIMDFYVNGDAAPGGRFNYIYKPDWSDDRYMLPEFPENINQGIKYDIYLGAFDSIPAFAEQRITNNGYQEMLSLPATTANNFGLRYTGFIDVPAKDEYTFYLQADLVAKLFIGNNLVVKTANVPGETSGTIKLMPGKHRITIDYITRESNVGLFEVKLAGSAITKDIIPPSMLFKYNLLPSIFLKFKEPQKYFSVIDTVIIAKGLDQDGSIATTEVYDNDILVNTESTPEVAIKNLEVGNHSIYTRVFDNNGAVKESNVLSFKVDSSLQIPGTIKAEEYMIGKSEALTNSTDTDGGKNVRVAYGWLKYPVNVAASGMYHVTFRVPSSTGSKKIEIKVNNVLIGSVDVGNTGNTQAWYDVSVDVNLTVGTQILYLSFQGIITIHRMDISYLSTGINTLGADKAGLVSVFPNPSTHDFMVYTQKQPTSIVLYDVVGKIVNTLEIKESKLENRIGGSLKPGLYLLVITQKDGSKQIIKLIKN